MIGNPNPNKNPGTKSKWSEISWYIFIVNIKISANTIKSAENPKKLFITSNLFEKCK